MTRSAPTEAWILAGELDGVPAAPALTEDVCGMPYVLRIAADLAHAGARTITVIWSGAAAPPSIAAYASDVRLKGAQLVLAHTAPSGEPQGSIIVARADRIYHRDLPKLGVAAWIASTEPARVAKVPETSFDAIFVMERRDASDFERAARAGEATAFLAAREVAPAKKPYLGFTRPAPDARSLRRAETELVWSMRKEAQGLAAYWINRHLSLPTTRAIMRTNILPNHVTVFCFLIAVVGGIVIGQGGYLPGVVGMALVNLGSILDGVDGELARLKYRFSPLGAWLDTLADDFANVAYVSGLAINLHASGVRWAAPLAITALACFAVTQSSQYTLITKVYKSGDLAAIPWAFQSTEFLTERPDGVFAWIKHTVPKMLKRDFALTSFVVLAAFGRLDVILVIFSAGAIVFFFVFAVQLLRNLGSVRAALAKSR